MRNLMKSAAVTAMLLASGLAQAAVITWSTGPTFNGSSGYLGILTNGSLVAAVNTGQDGVVPLTVDPSGLNITFAPLDSPFFPNYFFPSGSPGSTDSAWNSIIDSNEWSSGDFNATNFLNGLTLGNSYQVQFFAADSRVAYSSRTSQFGDGLGNFSASVVQGSFTSIVGTFIADASGQNIAFTTSSNSPILNAFVLRQTAVADPNPVPEPMTFVLRQTAVADPNPVPEPMTFSLLVAGLFGIAAMRRRRA